MVSLSWRSRSAARRSARWIRAALTHRGPEQRAAVQAIKAGVAAVAAWLLAAEVLGLPQPFLAPYTAIYLVEVTLYRSLLSAAQQVGAVAVGVLLAGGVGALLPTPVAIGVVTTIGLLLGRWHRLGSNGTWIALTALLVIAIGADGDRLLLVDRLVETVLGAIVGTVVNAVLLPPSYRVRAGAATGRAGRAVAELVGDMASSIRGDDLPDDRRDWVARISAARKELDSAYDLTGLSAENGRLRPRRSTDPRLVPQEHYRAAVRTLDAVWPYLRQLAESMVAPTGAVGEAGGMFADVLDDLAEAVRLVAAHQDRSDEVAELVDRCLDQLDDLDTHVMTTDSDSRGALFDLTGMTVPTRRALRRLAR